MSDPKNPCDPPVASTVARSSRFRLLQRYGLLTLGIAVTAVSLWLSFRGTSATELKTAFVSADYTTLPVLWLLLFGFYWLKVLRWKWLLAPSAALTTRQLFPPMLIGFAANNVLPAHLGEFVRVWEARRRFGIPVGTVLSTVVLERIFDVLAILAWFGAGLLFTDDLPAEYRRAAWLFGSGAAAVVVAVAVYLTWTDWFIRLTENVGRRIPLLPASLTNGVVRMLRQGADGLTALRSGRAVLWIALSSLIQWLLNGLIAFYALRAFHLPVTPATGLVVTGVTALGVTIPSTPGYFGVIQLCFMIAMNAQALKPDPSLVLGASLYYHMSMYIPVTALGLYFLHQSGQRLSQFQQAAEVPARTG
jgi:hypothetical protein